MGSKSGHRATSTSLQATACLVLAIVFATLAAAFGKAAAVAMPRFDFVHVATSRLYWLSLAAVGLQALVWPLALQRYTLSGAYLAMSIVYINVLAISHLYFNEPISTSNIIGAVLIAAGNLLAVSQPPGR